MNQTLPKFQDLLRELFQFDCADLDFGIYRIMNHKRDVVEKFIKETLPKAVAEELNRGALAEQSQAVKELEAAKKKVLEGLAEDALDAEGNLIKKYHDTKAGKEYLAARAKAAGTQSRDALETSIYNHLYAFFSRYYQDGDFISKRRYSKRERYAIPYNGEEVYLYWANHDQYYVKTAEYFTDYTWKAPNGVTVHFKLKAADVEQNNVKGEKRFFLPLPAEVAWDETPRRLVIPFEYRPLTEQENIAYGQKNQQEAIIAKALEETPKRLSPRTAGLALSALTAERRKTSDGRPVTCLEHHLRQYTRRNTSDFFIHKDLKGFLSRELDFYLKNEVLNLDEMEASGEDCAEGWFQMMRLIKAIGGRIIDFLHQIEEFQKMLWEKRKFILVEMADYFDTVLLPRIKKVTFTPEWKDGKPKRMATREETERSLRIVKYIRLESYEDALNNIALDDTSGQRAMQFDDYFLQYMLKWESRVSETLLNVEKLALPFQYKLHIHADGQTREKAVNIPETFNYLLGLHVRTRRVYKDGERSYIVYRGRIDHRDIAAIWRDTDGWQKADFESDKKFVTKQKLTEGADDVFVNGDSLIPGARALDPMFKARMFAGVEG